MLDSILGSDENNVFALIKELLTPDNIELKTDLNIRQVQVLTREKWYSLLYSVDPEIVKLTPTEKMQIVLQYFMGLMVSIGRLSRKEVENMMKNMKPEFMLPQNPFLDK